MDYINELKKFPLLKKISDDELLALSKLLKERTFKIDENIITEGDRESVMYILIVGIVDIIKTTMFNDEFVCATLDSNMHVVFGEMALLDNDIRSATVKAKTECITLAITSDDFNNFINEYPKAGIELLKFMNINLIRNLRAENNNLKLVYQALIEEIENN